MRLQRSIRSAVVRNRIKRRLRTVVYSSQLKLPQGVDIVIVGKALAEKAAQPVLRQELIKLLSRYPESQRAHY